MASLIRLFVEADLSAGAEIVLTQDQQRYLTNVMRRRAGDALRFLMAEMGSGGP